MIRLTLCYIFIFIVFVYANVENKKIEDEPVCKKLKDEIKKYQPIANNIIQAVTEGKFRGTTYDHLATFIDKFGPRFTGTENLENAINYMLAKSKKYNLENVRYENVTVPRWIRGNESATLIKPRKQNLRILGLGYSVGTPENGIKAEAIVVKDFQELRKKKFYQVKGKIVVFDQKYVSYGETVEYRSKGASEASRLGAVAALVNSVTPYSLNTPHTGMQSYYCHVKKIPVACITEQDAHMLRRMQNRGEKIVIHIKMDAKNLEPTTSRNTIAEIKGSQYPEKVVLVSGHLDSWDVGQGAMDDGGGAFISWNSLVILKNLGLRPKRTLRAVLWTAEEMGLIGAESYVNDHKDQINNFTFVMESDAGTFWPTGLAVSGTDDAVCIVKEVVNLLSSINTTLCIKGDFGPDIDHLQKLGVPGGSLLNKAEKYFVYHHTEADTVDVENSKALDYATALWATVSYVIADLSTDLPKILKLISNVRQPQEGPDIGYFIDKGVPGASLTNKNENYYIYHHSEADTMDVEDPEALDYGTAVWAVVSYIIADLSEDIPKILRN